METNTKPEPVKIPTEISFISFYTESADNQRLLLDELKSTDLAILTLDQWAHLMSILTPDQKSDPNVRAYAVRLT